MEETQKPFACTVEGCTMRFTNEDHLTVHKKKHDMVLNFGNGQKTNIIVADQTPTPTRFIRNCEEVGLFQDLQNVNPFEETFRKAVEATRVGGSHLEVPSSHMPVATDDTLHTPHVFPNIPEEHNSLSNLISAPPVETVREEKSLIRIDRQELETLEVVEMTNGAAPDLEADIEISTLRNVQVEVVKQEADTSQQIANNSSSSDPKLAVTNDSHKESVQVVIRMPDGQLVQLSGVPMGSLPSTQLPLQAVTLPQTTVISNIQLVQSPSQSVQHSTNGQSSVVNVSSSTLSVSSTSSSGTTSQARLSAAKMKLKQRIQFNSKQKSYPEPESTSTVQKKVSISRMMRSPSSDGSDSSVPCASRVPRPAQAMDVVDEQRQRFRERNRAAAMRCREKRKHWIIELEKRADETQRTNQQLNVEITKLRSEVVQLKTLLLAHKDCSVTKAMQQGIGIVGGSACPGKISPAVLHMKSTRSATAAPTLPVTLHNSINVNPPTKELSPKVVLLSKPSGLKRRRQAAASLMVSGSSETKSKNGQILQADSKLAVAQPAVVCSDSMQVSSRHLQQEVIKVVTDNSNSTSQTCVVTVTAPTVISGVPMQHGVTLKQTSGTSASYFIPPKILPQSTDNLPHVITLNPNILKTETLRTNIVTHASGDSSMDSGHGSDIEILADIPCKPDSKS